MIGAAMIRGLYHNLIDSIHRTFEHDTWLCCIGFDFDNPNTDSRTGRTLIYFNQHITDT